MPTGDYYMQNVYLKLPLSERTLDTVIFTTTYL